MGLLRVADLSDLPDESMLQVEVDGMTVVLCRYQGQVRALDGLCPHRNGPLGQGAFSGGRIVCPWHAWEFDCVSGEYDYDPTIRLTRYPAKIEDGQILVDLPGHS